MDIPGDAERLQAIGAWLAQRLPGARDVRAERLRRPAGAGNSAETLFVDASYALGSERRAEGFVFRIQKDEEDLFLDARLETPWRMMEETARHATVPVPGLIGLELDRSHLGAPFLVMREAEGRSIPQSPNYNRRGWLFDLAPAERLRLWSNGVRIMAEIHRLDWRDGFEFLHEPGGGEPGLAQLLNRTEAWADWALKGRPHLYLEAALRRLRETTPQDAPVEVLWGDPGTHNMLFKDDLTVSAVIDWEAAALGPGEYDLAWWLFMDELYSEARGVPRLEGLPDRDETIAIYEAAAGRKVRHMDDYGLLAEVRMCLIAVRTFDKFVARGVADDDPTIMTHSPYTRLLAKRLGMTPPEISPAFIRMAGRRGRPEASADG